MPKGSHDQSDLPPARRARTSFRVTNSVPSPQLSIPEGESARTSGSSPTVTPWHPLFSREDGSVIAPTNSLFKDPVTSFAFYRGLWTPKDIEVLNKMTFNEMYQRFPAAVVENTFAFVQTLFGMFTF
ncbi:uncharacterized protein LOC132300894 [Cornus florida]|uniref:uncharacterized protein LOC132300894 n=1 Tax=Cornus florida TaxID=4283 RepID=UPI002898E9E1|nr:uncharacterized protein LOC132300894 [Cornus florida]